MNKEDKYQLILKKKMATTIEQLTRGLPNEFAEYLNYCRKLRFDEKPDYQILRKIFRDLAGKQGIEYDQQYDWVIKKAGGNPQKQAGSGTLQAPAAPVQQQKYAPLDLGNNRREAPQQIPQATSKELPPVGRRGNTADAINIAKMGAEERKENRMMMGQVLMQAGRSGPGTLQNAAAAVLGGPYKNGQPPLTEERRNNQLGMNNGLPPTGGYRGQSISYPRGGTGGNPGSGFNDPFSSNHYSYQNNTL